LPQIPLGIFNDFESLKMLASTMQFSTFGRYHPWWSPARVFEWFDVRMAQPEDRPERKRSRSLRTQQCVWRALREPPRSTPANRLYWRRRAPGSPMSTFHP